MLCKIALYEPYSCFITGYKHKPTYFVRTIPKISKQLKGPFNYYVHTQGLGWGGWGGVHQNADKCEQGEGVSHQCERSHINFFNSAPSSETTRFPVLLKISVLKNYISFVPRITNQLLK